MFEKETRRKVTDDLAEYIEKTMINITKDRGTAGMLVLFFHFLIIFIVFYLLIWSSTAKMVRIGIVLWISIIIQYWYFHGCWGVKCERKIWKTKEWYGPWTAFYQYINELGFQMNKNTRDIFTFLFTIITSIIAIMRYKRISK